MEQDERQYGGLIDKYFIIKIIVFIVSIAVGLLLLKYFIYMGETAYYCNPPTFWEWLK